MNGFAIFLAPVKIVHEHRIWAKTRAFESNLCELSHVEKQPQEMPDVKITRAEERTQAIWNDERSIVFFYLVECSSLISRTQLFC